MSNTDKKFLFKGIMQYTKEQFEKLDEVENGVLYFVRETDKDNNSNGKSEIYFGNRKYSDCGIVGDIKCGTF